MTTLPPSRLRELRDRVDIVRDCDLDTVHLAVSAREAGALLEAYDELQQLRPQYNALAEDWRTATTASLALKERVAQLEAERDRIVARLRRVMQRLNMALTTCGNRPGGHALRGAVSVIIEDGDIGT
jgi:hypothetical protein